VMVPGALCQRCRGPWPAWIRPSKAVRDRHRVARGQAPEEAPWGPLELVDRYHATAEALEDCGQVLGTLHLERYWGDYAL
jgi:hypothetical protein